MARLDRLHPVKEVAQTAAVIGRAFDHATIAALLPPCPPAELDEAMRRLVEAELVFRRGTPPDATYLFKHALVRDAAYESLLKAKRAGLHARLVDILDERVSWLPRWWPSMRRRPARPSARSTWQQAGLRALARPAYREAVASFENAIRLCRSLGDGSGQRKREQSLQLQLGQALIANQGYQAPATERAFAARPGAGGRDRRGGPPAPRLVWPVGRPAHRGHGLGRASPTATRDWPRRRRDRGRARGSADARSRAILCRAVRAIARHH